MDVKEEPINVNSVNDDGIFEAAHAICYLTKVSVHNLQARKLLYFFFLVANRI